jgi:HEAT repeat protein
VAELVERILNRGTDEQGSKVLLSLIEQDRLDEAVELIREQEGTQLFVAAWRKSSLASRIGFMILVEAILQEDEHALDDSVPNLIAILDSGDASLRGDTADVLGQIGHPSAIPTLKNLQNDENPDVADIASEALGEIEDRME